METLATIVSFTLLVGLIIAPILILHELNRRNISFKFTAYCFLGILITGIITLTFAWWHTASNQLLLSYYDYNIGAWSQNEAYENVLPINIERVRNLETSTVGIGWPIKAMIMYLFYLPYLLFIFIIIAYLKKESILLKN